jgi:hypothetical protein
MNALRWIAGLGIIAWLGWLSGMAGFGWLGVNFLEFSIGLVSFSISVCFLLSVALGTGYAAWVMRMIWHSADTGSSRLAESLGESTRWFPATLLALSIANLVILGAMIPLLALLQWLMSSVSMGFALAMFPVTVVWALLTTALLPVACSGRFAALPSVGEGFRESIRGLGNWWLPVNLSVVLLGAIYVVPFSYTEHKNTEEEVTTFENGTHTTVTKRTNSTTNHHGVNYGSVGFSVAGFESDSRWSAEVADSFDTTTVPFLDAILTLLFGLLAIAIKIRIVTDLRARWGAFRLRPE